MKLKLLISLLSPSIFKLVSGCTSFDEALNKLTQLYDKPKNVIFARHLLATHKQKAGESIDQFLQNLYNLAQECDIKAVSLEQNHNDLIRDAFVTGLCSTQIRQRLLENSDASLSAAVAQARALSLAQQNSDLYSSNETTPIGVNAIETGRVSPNPSIVSTPHNLAISRQMTCYFCGNQRHARSYCPARDAVCHKCQRRGHFSKVCRSKSSRSDNHSNAIVLANLTSSTTELLSKSTVRVNIMGHLFTALIDSGSTDNFIKRSVAQNLRLKITSHTCSITLASSNKSVVNGICSINLNLDNNRYSNVKFLVLETLCCDVILGHSFLCLHNSVSIKFNGPRADLSICNLAAMNVESPSLFTNLDPSCRPIAIPSRRMSADDKTFIAEEIKRMLSEGIIEPSNSPWRAQVLVTRNSNHKKRFAPEDWQTAQHLYKSIEAFSRTHQFVRTLSTITHGTDEEKVDWIFSLYDIDGDGFISRAELTKVTSAIFRLVGGRFDPSVRHPSQSTIDERVESMMELYDTDKDGLISRDEFFTVALQVMPSITASVLHFSAHSFDTMHSLIGIVALLSYNIALTASEQISACPSQCICVETRMNCDQPGLQHLPPPYMSQLKYLVVENQTFDSTHLGPAELSVYRSPRYDGRVQLRNIQLRFCNIRTIGRYAFKHLGPGLELIDLTGNPLQQIGDYVFDGLSNLILILDRVTTQPRMTLNTFANVDRVKSLIVRNAEWTSLPFDALHQLAVVDRKFDKLVLKGNRLTHLDEKFDPIFQNLHAFEINDNPWHCDCQLNWIVRRYRRSLRIGHDDVGGDMTDWGQEDDKPKCTSPESLAGYNFTDLITELNELYNGYDNAGSRPPSILHCPPPQLTSLEVGMQKLSTNKKNQIIVRHESEASIELQCSVRGSKGLTIDWHYHDPITRSRTILNKGSMGRGENIVHDRSSLLTQKSVWVNRVNDRDRYTCLARDVIGNVSADVVVHWPELVISSIGGSKDTGDVIEPVDVSQSNQLAGDQSFMYSKQYTLIQLIGTIIGTFICTVLIFILILCIRQRVCKIYSASLVKRKTCDPDLVGRDNVSPGETSSSNTSSFATKSTAKQPVDNSACLTMPNGNGTLINPYMLFNNGCFHPNALQRLMNLNQTPATASDLAPNHPAYTFNAPQSNDFNSAVYDVPQTINSTTTGYNFQPNPMLDPVTLPLLGAAMATSQGATLDPNRLGPTIMIPPPPSSPQPALPGQFPGLIPPSSSYSTTNCVSLQPTTLTHNNINT